MSCKAFGAASMSAITVEQESFQLQSLGGSLAMSELGGRSAHVGDRPTCVIMSMLSLYTSYYSFPTCSNHVSCGLLLKKVCLDYLSVV